MQFFHLRVGYGSKEAVKFEMRPILEAPAPPPAICRQSSDAPLKRVKERERRHAVSLRCEWDACRQTFDGAVVSVETNVNAFERHVGGHIDEVGVAEEVGGDGDGEDGGSSPRFMCMWDDCGMTTTESREMVRHVHFHAFHARIKARGEQLMAEEGTTCKGSDDQQLSFEMSRAI